MAVGFELACLDGVEPPGAAAESPGGASCGECAACGGVVLASAEGIEARWAANHWRSLHGRARAREGLARKELARSRSASAVRELERTVSGLRHENARLRSRGEELESGNDRLRARNRRLTKERFGGGANGGGGRGERAARRGGRGPGRGSAIGHGVAWAARRVRPWRSSRRRWNRPTELSALRPGVRGERRQDDGADRGGGARRMCAACIGFGGARRALCAPARRGARRWRRRVPRLFPNTRYGVSVWALFLLEKYAHHRSLRAVSRMLSAHGLDLASGTLAEQPAPVRAVVRAAGGGDRRAAGGGARGARRRDELDGARARRARRQFRAAGCGCA